jgi:prephenate dehydrogenase
MAKSFKVKRGTYQREKIKSSGIITLLSSTDLKLVESISNNTMFEAKAREVTIPRMGVIGVGDLGQSIAHKFRSKGVELCGYDEDIEYCKILWNTKVQNLYDSSKPEFKLVYDYARSMESLVDIVKQPKAYPDGTPIDRPAVYFICTPLEAVESVKSELIPLLSNKDIIVDCRNKKISVIINGDKSGFIKTQFIELPFSWLEIFLETFKEV